MSATLAQCYVEIGSHRSGTNFLASVLSRHPSLAFWRRPKYTIRHGNAWKSTDYLYAKDATPRVKAYIRRRLAEYALACDKDRLLIVMQALGLGLEFIYEVIPDCKVIHIIRDGRDVVKSNLNYWHHPFDLGGSVAKTVSQRFREVPWTDLPAYGMEFAGELWCRLRGRRRYAWGAKIKNWKKLSRSMDMLEYCAHTWREYMTEARRVGLAMPDDQYREVKFEDLVRRPGETVAALLDYMQLPESDAVNRFLAENVDRTKPGNYQRSMPQEELDRIMPYIGDLLDELGYTSDGRT
jgi:hypothetical protein